MGATANEKARFEYIVANETAILDKRPAEEANAIFVK